MKFTELPLEAKELAYQTLSNSLLSIDDLISLSVAKSEAESVAAAFIAMERYDSAPGEA